MVIFFSAKAIIYRSSVGNHTGRRIEQMHQLKFTSDWRHSVIRDRVLRTQNICWLVALWRNCCFPLLMLTLKVTFFACITGGHFQCPVCVVSVWALVELHPLAHSSPSSARMRMSRVYFTIIFYISVLPAEHLLFQISSKLRWIRLSSYHVPPHGLL